MKLCVRTQPLHLTPQFLMTRNSILHTSSHGAKSHRQPKSSLSSKISWNSCREHMKKGSCSWISLWAQCWWIVCPTAVEPLPLSRKLRASSVWSDLAYRKRQKDTRISNASVSSNYPAGVLACVKFREEPRRYSRRKMGYLWIRSSVHPHFKLGLFAILADLTPPAQVSFREALRRGTSKELPFHLLMDSFLLLPRISHPPVLVLWAHVRWWFTDGGATPGPIYVDLSEEKENEHLVRWFLPESIIFSLEQNVANINAP